MSRKEEWLPQGYPSGPGPSPPSCPFGQAVMSVEIWKSVILKQRQVWEGPIGNGVPKGVLLLWQRNNPAGKPQCPTKNHSWDALGFNHIHLGKHSFPTLARQQLPGCATKISDVTARGRHEQLEWSTTFQGPWTQRNAVPELGRVFSSYDDQSAA